MKLGVIDVGGGLRGIYAAGVLDFCIQQGICFDYCVGVSAGSANLTAYMGGQYKRNFRFYHEYAFRKEYMGIGQFLRTRSYIDMNYVYGTLSNHDGEFPLNYNGILKNPAELIVVATEALTGKAKYFSKEDMRQDDYRILMASSSIPGINRPYEINGIPYFDGAISDPVPVKKAFLDGCDKLVILLTKPVNIPRTADKDKKVARLIRHKYPIAAEQLCKRAEVYNESVALARKYEEKGQVLIVSPDDITGVDTLTKNREALERLYEKGVEDGKKVKEWL